MLFAAVGALSLVLPLPAVPSAPAPVPVPAPVLEDTREPSRRTYAVAPPLARTPVEKLEPTGTPAVGTARTWLALDDVAGRYYRKTYTLRGAGEHIEVWVADDLAFPADDCRTDPVTVTDPQVRDLIHQFDTVIHPRETAAFSTPPGRDGTGPALDGDFRGAGDRTVTLVDNIRDDNYFTFPKASTYVAGFFSEQLNDLVDRNVMTIDAYDWKHRTGASPPDDSSDDLCTSRPARPRMYEGTFAHEWQHLLQSYTDPDEELWVNEGLSDYAQSLTGYVDTVRNVHRRGADAHLACYQGFATVRTSYNTTPRDCGGPQNSLNLWNEGEPAEVLADYGIAYQFMLYLKDRFGPGVLSRIHRDGTRQGIPAIAAALPAGFHDVLHDFQTMTLVDKIIGDGDPRFSARSLRSTVNLANPDAYARPGAAPNGADYVKLKVRGRDLRSVEFTGAPTLPPDPMTWTAEEGALFSGTAADSDATAATEVTVPSDRAEAALTISTRYDTEAGFDFGYVTVSADRGRTWTAVRGDNTVEAPLGPAISGSTGGGFVPHSYDLSAYTGRRVLLAFRYVSDAAVHGAGWLIKDIRLGGTAVPAGPANFRSYTQIRPVPVHHFEAALIGLTGTTFRRVAIQDFAQLRDFDRVVAVIAHDDPTGTVDRYARYRLTVNGVRQPGG